MLTVAISLWALFVTASSQSVDDIKSYLWEECPIFLKCVEEWHFKNTNWGGLSPECYPGTVNFSRQIAVLFSHSHLAGRCLDPY